MTDHTRCEIQVKSGIAQIVSSSQVVWESGFYEVGDYLNQERVKLKKGMLFLEFENGVELIVEGPAEFELISPLKMLALDGKLRAQVPDNAHGFRIETQTMDIVDLGTEFGVEVKQGDVNVQVFDGEVKLVDDDQDIKNMVAGEAVQIHQNKIIEAVHFDNKKYIGEKEFLVLKRANKSKAYLRWIEYAKTLQTREDLVAYYYFANENKWANVLPNKKIDALESTYGQVKFAKRRSGRFSNDEVTFPNHAFGFENQNSRILIDLPEKMTELTMMCWVQVHSLGSPVSSLLQAHKNKVGYPSWFMMRDAKMWFNLERPSKGSDFREGSHASLPVWNPGMRKVWMQLAVKIDEKNVTFYKNGRELNVSAHEFGDKDILISVAELGNCLREARFRGLSQNFHGLMDEFLIFNKALSESEIQEIYSQGNIE